MNLETNRFRDRSRGDSGRPIRRPPQPMHPVVTVAAVTPTPAVQDLRPDPSYVPPQLRSQPTPTMPPQPKQTRVPQQTPPVVITPTTYNPVPLTRQVVRPQTGVRAPVAQTAPAQVPPVLPHDSNISINISLPKLHRPHLPALPYKKIGLWLAILAAVAAIGLTGYKVISNQVHKHRLSEAVDAIQEASAQKGLSKPTFAPVSPVGKTALAKLNQPATGFDGSRNTFSYADTLDSTQVIVSQQPIPGSFKTAATAVASIAKSLDATTPLLTNTGTAYIATDSQSNAQTVVYTLHNVLIFIQCPFTHPNIDWINYLNSLEQS